MDLEECRSLIPEWPSEFDTARKPDAWLQYANSFRDAALVLERDRFETQGPTYRPPTLNPYGVMCGNLPSLFCLSFSLELAVKAALVAQNELGEHAPGQRLPFARGHELSRLARQVRGLSLDERQEVTVRTAGEIVARHRYPVGVMPRDDTDGIPPAWSFPQFEEALRPVWEQLVRLAEVRVDA